MFDMRESFGKVIRDGFIIEKMGFGYEERVGR